MPKLTFKMSNSNSVLCKLVRKTSQNTSWDLSFYTTLCVKAFVICVLLFDNNQTVFETLYFYILVWMKQSKPQRKIGNVSIKYLRYHAMHVHQGFSSAKQELILPPAYQTLPNCRALRVTMNNCVISVRFDNLLLILTYRIH